jgi:hypothetical protein
VVATEPDPEPNQGHEDDQRRQGEKKIAHGVNL